MQYGSTILEITMLSEAPLREQRARRRQLAIEASASLHPGIVKRWWAAAHLRIRPAAPLPAIIPQL